jgi:5-methyltetrahydrofolate--homocysteine methyltransferase
VIDLGVMVPAETIVQRAIEENVDIVGLSGLITPSLDEMVNVAKLFQQQGKKIPLMIGGATTSALHTALKIAPVYDAPVVWMKDASQNALVAARLLNDKEFPSFVKELNEQHETLRQKSVANDKPLTPLNEAREKGLKLF